MSAKSDLEEAENTARIYADKIDVLQKALNKHHTGIGAVNYCRTCGSHFDWQTLNTADTGEARFRVKP